MALTVNTPSSPPITATFTSKTETSNGIGLSPIGAIISLMLINIIVLSIGNENATKICAILVLIAIATLKKTRLFLNCTAVMAISLGLSILSLTVSLPGPIAYFGVIGFWIFRFTITITAGIYLLLTVKPGEFTATLHKLRLPSWLVIPLTVILRFFPHARQEFRAILEATSLRGLPLDLRNLIFHPLRSLEYVLVPMLVSCSRIADDLAASVLIRGLGSAHRPTPLKSIRITITDVTVIPALFSLPVLSLIQVLPK